MAQIQTGHLAVRPHQPVQAPVRHTPTLSAPVPEIGAGRIGSRDYAMARLARRVWRMEQDAIRFSLRELGIPLETGSNSGTDEEIGYRISRQAYELPEIRLEPDEAAVLGLAARVWRQAELAGADRGDIAARPAADDKDFAMDGVRHGLARIARGSPEWAIANRSSNCRLPTAYSFINSIAGCSSSDLTRWMNAAPS